MTKRTIEELDKQYGLGARYAFEKYFEEQHEQYIKELLPMYAEGAGFTGGETASNGVSVFQIGEDGEGAVMITKSRSKAINALTEVLNDWGLDPEYIPTADQLQSMKVWMYDKPDGYNDDPYWTWYDFESKHPGARDAFVWRA